MRLTSTLGALAILASSASAQQLDGQVSAVSKSTTVRPATVGEEGPLRYASNRPVGWENAVEKTLTHDKGKVHTGPTFPISYDLRTGEERIHPMPVSSIAPSGSVAGHQVGEELRESMGRSFGQLSSLTSTSYPWSTHARMWFSQSGLNYVCSGTMIDARNFITAGHCVHEGSGGGWSTNISISPSYDGDDDAFGSANGQTMVTWTTWTNSSSWDGDQAIVRVDRPVGSLTGWLGYGWNSSNTFWDTTSMYTTGYPGGSSWSGAPNQFYYGYGSWDDVDTYTVEADCPPWTYWFGGMSGGGIYDYNGGNRITMANNSYGWGKGSNITSRYGVCRMTQGKFDHYNTVFIPGAYSSVTPDYIPLRCEADMGGASVTAGDNLADFDYRVFHNSTADPANQNFPVDVYLSTNDNISTFDTLIDSHSFNWDFAPKSSVNVNVGTGVTIPANTSGGNYWVGVILDIVDGDVNNNDTDGWDAAEITVVEPPPAWPNLPFSFQSVGSQYHQTFEGLGGGVPSHMAINRLDTATRLFDSEAWCNVGQLGAASSPFNGSMNLEMGLTPGSTNYHNVSNGLVVGLNGGGKSQLELDFTAINYGEESTTWDGIWISSNGTDWNQVYGDWGSLPLNTWTNVRGVDLHGNGVSTTGNFYLLFAQEDNFPYGNLDGIGIDEIQVHAPAPTLSITPNPIVSFQPYTITVRGGSPNGRAFVAWSTQPGPTPSPYGTLDVAPNYNELPSPILLDGFGTGTFSGTAGNGAGLTIYVHALDVPSFLLTNSLAVPHN